MKILGIIPAKSESYRFPGKNKRLFYDVAATMLASHRLSRIVVASDDNEICKIANEMGCSYYKRTKSEIKLNLPMIDVLKHVFLAQQDDFTHVLCIFGCTVNVTDKAIRDICERAYVDIEAQEIRSFDRKGHENGMFMLTKKRLLEGHISSYLGCVINDLKEIHTEDQL